MFIWFIVLKFYKVSFSCVYRTLSKQDYEVFVIVYLIVMKLRDSQQIDDMVNLILTNNTGNDASTLRHL